LVGLCMIAVGLPGGLLWLTGWDIARATAAKSGRLVAETDYNKGASVSHDQTLPISSSQVK
jgi:hypothetical protein